ncbi:putative serine/threonine-protein kinase [Actinoplanes sp. N902-109]|nr:putative serine/threonine-protein kinase [Actinoplanes sp. N902-109]
MPLRATDPPRLGRYDLVARLGQGGMGTVFLGRAPDGTPVAVKMIRPEFTDDDEFSGRFHSEVRRAQQVPPFSTAAVLDADPGHDPPYLVVEYVDGPSLSTLVTERGLLTGAALHQVAVGIATALTAIHGAGVIHRDLKPGNVLVAMGGIKVIDFGIARAFEATSRHTRTDQMVGTVAYMAPERFEPSYGGEVTAASDIFAWGAVVTYAATGRTPFAADSPAATAARILTQPPDTAGVPEPVRGLVEWALAKHPDQRPTARELLDALLSGATAPVRAAPVAVPPPDDTVLVPVPPRRRSGLRRLAVAAGVAVLLLCGGLVALHEIAGRRPTAAGAGDAAPAPVDPQAEILAGHRRFAIELASGGRFFALDRDRELTVSDGTGSQAEFVLRPEGVDYLIKSLSGEGFAGPDVCLGVKKQPDEDSWPVVGAACTPTAGTLFSLYDTGKRDARGRPAYSLRLKDGWLLWDADRKTSDVTEVGEALFADKYTFADRGEL